MKRTDVFGILTSPKASAAQKKRAERKLGTRKFIYIPHRNPYGCDSSYYIDYSDGMCSTCAGAFQGTYKQCIKYINDLFLHELYVVESNPKFSEYYNLRGVLPDKLLNVMDDILQPYGYMGSNEMYWMYGMYNKGFIPSVITINRAGEIVIPQKWILGAYNAQYAHRKGWIQKKNVTEYYCTDRDSRSKIICLDGRIDAEYVLIDETFKPTDTIGGFKLHGTSNSAPWEYSIRIKIERK